jgi:hypothetical protein
LKNRPISRTCSTPIAPSRWAAAVAGHRGASGSPVSALRGPSWSASRTRRRASAGLIRNRSANAISSRPPNSSGTAWAWIWLIASCSTTGSWRRTCSVHSSTANRSGVVSVSKRSPATSAEAALSRSSAAITPSRSVTSFEHMYEYYRYSLTRSRQSWLVIDNL